MITAIRNLRIYLIPLAFVGASQPAAATHPLHPFPVKVDMQFQWNVRLLTPQQMNPYQAPWYLYFPYDPNLQTDAAGTQFPHWPHPFPPKTENQNDSSNGNHMTISHYQQPAMPQASSPAHSQVPSYWYQQ